MNVSRIHEQIVREKFHIREKKKLSTNADSSTASKAKFAQLFCTLYEKKFLNLRPLLSIAFFQGFQKSKKFGHWTS